MRTRTGRAVIAVALALGLGVTVSVPAAAATKLGETFVPDFNCGNGPEAEAFATHRDDGTSYAAPTAGVITSWSHRSSETTSADSQLTLRVFRPTASPDQFTVVGEGGPLRDVAAHSGLNTFATRVPVQAGDIIGYRATQGPCTAFDGSPGDRARTGSGTATPVGGTGTYTTGGVGAVIDISAVLEPDADRDGYGDETQDACPTSASLQTACPPPDTVLKKKPKPTLSAVTKFRFRATTPGATFRCSVDDGTTRTCRSPAKYRCLSPGKHTFTVAAVSSAGAVDPTPARTTFKVRGHRPAC